MAVHELDLGDIAGNAAAIPDGSVLFIKGGKICALTPGTNGQVLEANSAAADKINWATDNT